MKEKKDYGQCVYAMSTGKRCPKDATQAVRFGSIFDPDPPAYGYCLSHYLSVTQPRDSRIHRTAEPLIRVEAPQPETGEEN